MSGARKMAVDPALSEEWKTAKLLYPVYCALARECVIDAVPCAGLERQIENPTEESLQSARLWFSSMDEAIQVHQLRHFLQTNILANREILRLLLLRHLRKPGRTQADRNKTDFLLVQFFSLSVSSHLADTEIDLGYVAQLLQPVLGRFDLTLPQWLAPLEELTRKAQTCSTLHGLLTCRVIEQGRKLKESGGNEFFTPIAMAAFTRFGFLLRRLFFRLMQQDLNAILDGLRVLEARGIKSLDCRKAQFSAYEPMSRLRIICRSWKVMFHAEYASGQPLSLLADLRTVVDAALAKTTNEVPLESSPHARETSYAAAAGAENFSAASSFNNFRELKQDSLPSTSQNPGRDKAVNHD